MVGRGTSSEQTRNFSEDERMRPTYCLVRFESVKHTQARFVLIGSVVSAAMILEVPASHQPHTPDTLSRFFTHAYSPVPQGAGFVLGPSAIINLWLLRTIRPKIQLS